MTAKDYRALADALRSAHPRVRNENGSFPLDIATDAYWSAVQTWENVYREVARVCAMSNGRFDRDRFAMAAGYAIRPDGSLWPVAGRDRVR